MNRLTFEQSEEASLQCDYAIDAAGTIENPINWGDAAGFYLSGYNTACDEAEKEIAELQATIKNLIDLQNYAYGYRDKALKTLSTLNYKVREKDAKIAELEDQLESKTKQVTDQTRIIEILEDQVFGLNTKLSDLHAYHMTLLTCDNPSQVEPSIAELVKRLQKLESITITTKTK